MSKFTNQNLSNLKAREAKSRPLVTLVVCAFQQEEYIAEAVKAALAQTYQPLEVILSDDCSTDRTFDVMKEFVGAYNGNAQVRLNRMETNSGLVVHLNKVVSMSKGELIVLAAGDDISEPFRVELLVERWAKADFASGSIFSQYLAIEENGNPIAVGGHEPYRTADSWMRTVDRDVHVFASCPGCTQAFTPDLIQYFGELEPGIIQEDICLQLRASLIGGVGFVNQPLVRYRQTKVSQSRSGFRLVANRQAKRMAYLKSFLRVYDLYARDCQVALERNDIRFDDYQWALLAINQYAEPMRQELDFLQSGFGERMKMVFAPKHSPGNRARWLLYALFPRIYGWRSQKFPKIT